MKKLLLKICREAGRLGIDRKIFLEKSVYNAYTWIEYIDDDKIIVGYSDKLYSIEEKYYYLLARHEICHVLDILDKLYDIDIAAPDIRGIELIAEIGYRMYTDYLASKRYIDIYGMRSFKKYLRLLSRIAPSNSSLEYLIYMVPAVNGFKKYRDAKKYFPNLKLKQWILIENIKNVYENWRKKYDWKTISIKIIFLTLVLQNLETEKIVETIYLTSDILEE